ncbi:MAG: hypothetical protein U0441_03480 [Polyangiaceae bacterium]
MFRFLQAAPVALLVALSACSGGGEAVPPPTQAPTQVAACLTFYLEEVLPGDVNLDAYDMQTIDSVRRAVVAELVAAGFAIVESKDKPYDVVLKLTATPASRIETNAKLRGKFSIEGEKGVIDTVETAAPGDAQGANEAVAAGLVDGLFRSSTLGGYIKQLRRPGSTGLARTSLRNMAPACEGFVVPATASAAPTATAAPTASAAATAPVAPRPPDLLAGTPQPEAYAIVFGVEQYKNAAAAPGARADAEEMVRLVTRTFGVPEAHVKTAFNDKADRLAIDLNLEWLKLNVPRGARVYFYFAGNGWGGKAPGAPSILPYDADPKTGAKTVLVASLLQSLSETKAGDVILITDTSYAGTGGRSIAPGSGPLFGIKGTTAAVRTVMLSAVSGSEGARLMPDGGGAFTHYLIEAVGHGHADENADGRVSLEEAHKWITARVERAAKRENKAQTPSIALGPAVLPSDKLYLATGLETP